MQAKGIAPFLLVLVCGFVAGCFQPTIQPTMQPTMLTCQYSETGETLRYPSNQDEPQSCLDYIGAWYKKAGEKANEDRRRADEEAKKRADRERQEAWRKLLTESPVQSEQGLKHDLELAEKLTPVQRTALDDAVNHVILTKNEKQALRSISLDQWHAISQLAAFYKWLNDKIQEAQAKAKAQAEQDRTQAEQEQAAAEKQQEQVQREEDRVSLAIYQSLMTEAAERQAAATQWQAAAAWRQQQCLSDMSHGLRCY
jgi:hypothetical protein